MFEFFRIWLIVLCAGFVVLGTAMALLAGTRAMAPMDWIAESASLKRPGLFAGGS